MLISPLLRSQGIYFYRIVQKSPPDTYLADLKHVSQPSSTSFLGRLLREACGTLPQLISQDLLRDSTQSRRAWHNFEIKYDPSPMAEPNVSSDQNGVDETIPLASHDFLPNEDPASMIVVNPIQELASATQPSLASLPAQLPLSVPVPETPPGSAGT